MKFLAVNYYLNQTYMVENTALVELVQGAIKNIDKIELKDIKIDINNANNGFEVKLIVGIKKGASIKEAALKIQEQIEQTSLNITSSKPENIQVVFREI